MEWFSPGHALLLALGCAAACPSLPADELPPALIQGKAPITALVALGKGDQVLAGSQAGIAGCRIETSSRHIHETAVSPNRNRLAIAGGSPGEEGVLEVFQWNRQKLAASRMVFRKPLHSDVIYSLAWSPDGQSIVTGGHDHVVRIVDSVSGKARHALRGHSRGVTCVRFVNAELVVTASLDGTIRVWEFGSGKLVRTLSQHRGPVLALARRPSQAEESVPMIASVSDDATVRMWQPTIGRLVRFARLTTKAVSVAWLPDGSSIVAGCADGRLRFVDPETVDVREGPRVSVGPVWSLAVIGDGKRIAIGGHDGAVRIVNMDAASPAKGSRAP